MKSIRGSRHSIGYKKSDPNFVFKQHELTVHAGMKFYITSDGFLDQNGGEKGFPFGKKRFQAMIKEHSHLPMQEQMAVFEQTLLDYQRDHERNDDITLIGFEIDLSRPSNPEFSI